MPAEPSRAGADFLLSRYEHVLQVALKAGYAFAGFDEIGKEKHELSCLLRHDVDVELWHCDPISRIEHERGVRATYFLMMRSTAYNLFCTESIRAVEMLLQRNHWIGLHFMGELCEGLPTSALMERVAGEVEMLRREFGCGVHAVSFHQPSARILEGDVKLDGVVNTYNRWQMEGYEYVSDTNMHWRQEHPEEIFRHRLYRRLHLLIHPIWWTRNSLATIAKWTRVLDGNSRTVVQHWLARERSLAGVSVEDLLSQSATRQSQE